MLLAGAVCVRRSPHMYMYITLHHIVPHRPITARKPHLLSQFDFGSSTLPFAISLPLDASSYPTDATVFPHTTRPGIPNTNIARLLTAGEIWRSAASQLPPTSSPCSTCLFSYSPSALHRHMLMCGFLLSLSLGPWVSRSCTASRLIEINLLALEELHCTSLL